MWELNVIANQQCKFCVCNPESTGSRSQTNSRIGIKFLRLETRQVVIETFRQCIRNVQADIGPHGEELLIIEKRQLNMPHSCILSQSTAEFSCKLGNSDNIMTGGGGSYLQKSLPEKSLLKGAQISISTDKEGHCSEMILRPPQDTHVFHHVLLLVTSSGIRITPKVTTRETIKKYFYCKKKSII